MSPRAHIPVKDKVTVAIAQAQGGHIVCPLCGKWLEPDEPRVLEHIVCYAFTKSHETKFLAWVHKPCADRKTLGKSKATCADGDIHKIAKAKRLATARQVHEQVKARVIDRPPGKIRNRNTFAESKLKRSFPTKKKPFGEVRTR